MVFLRFLTVYVFVYAVKCDLYTLTCEDVKIIVDWHNSRRLMLAQGKVPGQPAASQMNMVIWDDALCNKSFNWAARNQFSHDPDTKDPQGRWPRTGQNLYWSASPVGYDSLDMEKVMNIWFDEHKDFPFHTLSYYDFSGPIQIGHYTQVAWSDTVCVGCGVSRYFQNNYYNQLVVCDYGPGGNIFGQTPYKTDGPGSGRLDCGMGNCSRMYGHC